MSITKRDIADIVLVWMALSFLVSLLTSIITLGAMVGMTGVSQQYVEKSVTVTFQAVQIVALLFLNYVLLFRRPILLSILFPDAKEKELSLPEGLIVLRSYAFWIRLLGIFIFLKACIGFLGGLAMDLATRTQFAGSGSWMLTMRRTGSELVSAILGAIVIWKSNWIAEKLGSSNNGAGGNAAPPRASA